MQIPGTISSISTQGLLMTILFIVSIGLMLKINYNLLKTTEDTSINLRGKPYQLSISGRGSYNSAIVISSMISGLLQNNIISSTLMLILNPIILYVLNSSYNETSEELNKYLSYNDLYINGVRHGGETKKHIDNMLKKNSFTVGVVGAVIFIVSSIVVKVFSVAISPLILIMAVNSFLNLQFGVKAICRAKQVKNLVKI